MIIKAVRLILSFTPILAMILIFLQFLVSNQLASLGQKMQYTDNEISRYSEENENLRQQVASASSLATIRAMASKQGFTQTPNYIVIGSEEFALQHLR